MNEEEKEDIELDIEAKYVDKTEKEFLSRVTYAECLYILTPKNKYCDKIKELSVLKICEIIEKLQKENEELKEYIAIAPNLDEMTAIKYRNIQENAYVQGRAEEQQKAKKIIYENYIPKQKVKDKIEELEEELEIMKVDNMYGRYKEYGGKTKWERLFATKYGMHDALQELLEGRK